jgi:hypothetical protein
MSETPAPLADLELVAGEIFERWDKDMRSGKLLAALSGLMAPGYDPRVDRIRQSLAAAPYLLEALIRCEEMVSTDKGPPDWKAVRAAISKATGASA